MAARWACVVKAAIPAMLTARGRSQQAAVHQVVVAHHPCQALLLGAQT